MTTQHLQTASLPLEVATAMPSASFANAELQNFIAACRDAREARKALAVKLIYQDYLYEEIQTILDVSLGSITGWILLTSRMESLKTRIMVSVW